MCDLPQGGETFATLGSSPYWCWGYEEGINEHGVVIGNEAIYTKSFAWAVEHYPHDPSIRPGLLGMDLVRLGLERAATAGQAVSLMGRPGRGIRLLRVGRAGEIARRGWL